MKTPRIRLPFAIATAAVLAYASLASAAENFDDALKREAIDYAARLKQAGEDLNRAREQIAREKAPLLAEMRKTQDRLIALERETEHLSTGQEEHGNEKRRLLHEIEELRRNNTYLASLASDGLKALNDGLAPGESEIVGGQLQTLQDKLNAAASEGGGPEAMDAAAFLLDRAKLALGGETARGRAMNAENNRIMDGTFAFAGPGVFFRPSDGSQPGTVRLREGSLQPVYYPLKQWGGAEAAAFFDGRKGTMVADASGGKALKLEQASGTIIDHINKGGKVAYAIIFVGFISLILIIQKSLEIFRFGSDSPARVSGLLDAVAKGSREEARERLLGLRRVTRELFEEGLRNLDQPRTILEERLESLMLANRLHLERRLPLLAVIATAAPLMGLLGTVVGMVRTFSLITVFGTGNAGKLSGGISEVLVATELGLTVAIPTLVIHGFLASRAHRHLALLERHALDFVTAAEVARTSGNRAAETEEVGA